MALEASWGRTWRGTLYGVPREAIHLGSGDFSPGKDVCAKLGRNQQNHLNLQEHENLDSEHEGENWLGLKLRRIDLNEVNQSR